jgi:hypothetical protein
MPIDKPLEEGAPARSLPKLASTAQQDAMESIASAAGRIQARRLGHTKGAPVKGTHTKGAPARSNPVFDADMPTGNPVSAPPTDEEQDLIENYMGHSRAPVVAKPVKLTVRQLVELSKPNAGDTAAQDWNPAEINERAKNKMPGRAGPLSGPALAALAMRKRS